jgi:hypothetical protein
MLVARWRRFRARMRMLLVSEDDVPCIGGMPYSMARCRLDRAARDVKRPNSGESCSVGDVSPRK